MESSPSSARQDALDVIGGADRATMAVRGGAWDYSTSDSISSSLTILPVSAESSVAKQSFMLS